MEDETKMKLKQSQVTIEFVSIVALGLIICVSFSAYALGEMKKNVSSMRSEELQKISLVIKEELMLAGESIAGYNRIFYLPEDAYDENYSIIVMNNTWIELHTDKESIMFQVSYFEGSIGQIWSYGWSHF